MQTTIPNIFTTISTEGAILPTDLLGRIANGDKDIEGLNPQDYHLPAGEKVNEATSRSWNRLVGYWVSFKATIAKLPQGDPGTTDTRERWLLHLFNELGYGRLPTAKSVELEGKSYPISHVWGHVPIHLVGVGVDLDRRTAGVAGAARSSPHSMVQELLNGTDEYLWAFLSNGLGLRILRDNSSLTRQAFVEFDLEAMMEGEVYSDFVLLWLLCHQSRVEGDKPEECWLEKWSSTAQKHGTRALEGLRSGVEAAIKALGQGFLGHRDNRNLRERLRSGQLNAQDYYRQLLRLVYRLIFLFVAEDRDLLLDPGATQEARKRYTDYYSTGRLRWLAERQRGTRHADLNRTLRLVMEMLGRDDGCPALGLPALGSFLFQSGPKGAVPDLEGCEIANHDLLDAIRELAFTTVGRSRRRVDYHNLGSEELGSVYEALLEQHPEVNTDAPSFDLKTAMGNERKGTGSYYTPTSLITSLLDSALDPVLEEAARKPDPESAILNLKICDPACGSGHFLVAAAHRTAKRLAAVRTGEAEPSPEATRNALRDVIGRCVYGVDVNDMAVELCKVSLWMEALLPGRPLSFLDHHIQLGNSLLGATPKLLNAGIPDEAFEPIEGDDRAVCAEYKRRNRQERGGQLRLHGHDLQPYERLGNLAAGMMSLNTIDDANIGGVKSRQELWESLVASSNYENELLWANAWCAAFVWKKTGQNYPITESEFRRIEAHGQHGTDPWRREEIGRLAKQYVFFHWHLAFFDVFRVPGADERAYNEQAGWKGGFDVVLGNPPWEHTELKEKEWFAVRAPEIANARTGAARKQRIDALEKEDPTLHAAFLEARREHDGIAHFIGHSDRYPLCGRGRINTYAIFAEGMRDILSHIARMGVIVPSGIASDDTTKFFFRDLMDTRSLVSLFDFENREELFKIHRNYKFCLLTVSGPSRPVKMGAQFVFFALSTDDLLEEERRFTLSSEDVALLNPNTRTCPIFRSKRDAELTKAVYRRLPVLIREGAAEQNFWSISLKQGLFNMASDSGVFRTREYLEGEGWQLLGNVFQRYGDVYLPLYEAKMTGQFDHRAANVVISEQAMVRQGQQEKLNDQLHQGPLNLPLPRYWVSVNDVMSQLAGKWTREWLMGWRDVTTSVASRTMSATVLPLAGCGDTFLLMLPDVSDDSLPSLLLACLNSYALDYLARQKVGGIHLKFNVFKQLPVLPPLTYNHHAPWSRAEFLKGWLLPRVLELTYTAWDLEPFAKDCGYDGPPFRWDEQRRFLLRCELDAAYFHLYGIARDDVDYIMDTFPIVRRKDEAKHGEYRTKRIILEVYDAMQRASETGQSYQPLLDPPPADPRVAHPPRSAEYRVPGAEWGSQALPRAAEERAEYSVASVPKVEAAVVEPVVPEPPERAALDQLERVAVDGASRDEPAASGGGGSGDDGGAVDVLAQQVTFIEAPVEEAFPALGFKAGDVVRHAHFGEGKVTAVRPDGDDQMVTVVFQKAGTRKFMAKMGKLEKP